MDSLNIKTFPKPEEAALYGGYALNKLLEDNKDKPVLLLLAAGSNFELLEGINPENLSEQTTVSMTDDRFSSDPEINNFLQLQKTEFYKSAQDRGCSFFGSLPRTNETKEQLAERWENNIKKWRNGNPSGKILATIGMGPDGHIAGVMPFPEDEKKFQQLFESESWLTAYDAEEKHKHRLRITSTLTFLKRIDAAVSYISGQGKQVLFDRVKQKQNALHELPAMAFWEMKNLEIYTDLN